MGLSAASLMSIGATTICRSWSQSPRAPEDTSSSALFFSLASFGLRMRVSSLVAFWYASAASRSLFSSEMSRRLWMAATSLCAALTMRSRMFRCGVKSRRLTEKPDW